MVDPKVWSFVSSVGLFFGGAFAFKWWSGSAGNRNEQGNRWEEEEDGLETQVTDAISCPVCRDVPFVPLGLGCGHTVCVFCMDKLYAHKAMEATSGRIQPRCPVCRFRVTEPINDLKPNFAVQELVRVVVTRNGKDSQLAQRREEAANLFRKRMERGYPRAAMDPSTVQSRLPLGSTASEQETGLSLFSAIQ